MALEFLNKLVSVIEGPLAKLSTIDFNDSVEKVEQIIGGKLQLELFTNCGLKIVGSEGKKDFPLLVELIVTRLFKLGYEEISLMEGYTQQVSVLSSAYAYIQEKLWSESSLDYTGLLNDTDYIVVVIFTFSDKQLNGIGFFVSEYTNETFGKVLFTYNFSIV